jgi:hypothetical protein
MRTITIDVTAEDIKRGYIADCQDCPVALAVRRALGLEPYYYLGVGPTCIYFYDGPADCGRAVELPPEAVAWIAALDRHGKGLHARPFTFTVSLPDRVTADA